MITRKRNLILIILTIMSINGFCQSDHFTGKTEFPESQVEITLLDSATYLYKVGNFYLSGQPNDSIIIALKNQNLKLIINIRTPEEMEIVKENGFDEDAIIDSLNIPYVHIPVGGKAGYSQEAIKDINLAIQQYEGDIMIHCRTAGRATLVWMAWLINYKHMPIDDAIALGKQIRFQFTLEDLLDYELSFNKK